MRLITTVLVLCVLVLGVHALAQGDDGKPDDLETLTRKVELLQLQVELLGLREKALSDYILAQGQGSATLSVNLQRSRDEGFTMGAISAPSREFLLGGLEAAAKLAQQGLPVATREEIGLQQRISHLQKKN